MERRSIAAKAPLPIALQHSLDQLLKLSSSRIFATNRAGSFPEENTRLASDIAARRTLMEMIHEDETNSSVPIQYDSQEVPSSNSEVESASKGDFNHRAAIDYTIRHANLIVDTHTEKCERATLARGAHDYFGYRTAMKNLSRDSPARQNSLENLRVAILLLCELLEVKKLAPSMRTSDASLMESACLLLSKACTISQRGKLGMGKHITVHDPDTIKVYGKNSSKVVSQLTDSLDVQANSSFILQGILSITLVSVD